MKIGTLTCRNRVFLAPMSGITDVPFRKVAWKLGAGLVFSEMVASEALVHGQGKMSIKAQSAGLPIHAVQIAGRQAKWMGLAARLARDNGADLIDINMGCPSRRVTSGLSGSALMRDLDHAMGLIKAVVEAVDVPVTLKMRLGWDDNSINAPQLAIRAQAAGVAMISVHGRTRCQFYKGKADWRAIGSVREAIDLPLVVNGDITNSLSAANALRLSGGDAVMVGRACYGAPWLPGELARGESASISLMECGNIILEHFEEMLEHFGDKTGIRQFRKHLGWYLDNLEDANNITQIRKTLLTSVNPVEIRALISRLFHQPREIAAA
ncbi:MAG: tRNA dihydrouridine synthase DusB [Rhizobiaceae bacterium]|nr:tRNA dihydrouridine synthase DusB [Rhizobiaceae bacterium]